MTSFELWLTLGALGLYLFDSLQWLYSNELIFMRRDGLWRGSRIPALLVAGRRVYLPNPLTPGTPQFKVRWSESDPRTDAEEGAELEQFLRALRPVGYFVNTLLGLLAALPVVLLLFGTGVELLALMAAFYAAILVALGYIFSRRHVLRLTSRAFAALCFDALACAPFAINLVRKLALRRSLAGNPLSFAERSFAAPEFALVIDAVTARVAEELLREDGPTPRAQALEAYRQRLAAMVHVGRPI